MKPIPFEGQNIVYAENQKEYVPLPAFREVNDKRGTIVFCMSLSIWERLKLLITGRLWCSLLLFNKPIDQVVDFALTPSFMSVHKDEVIILAPREQWYKQPGFLILLFGATLVFTLLGLIVSFLDRTIYWPAFYFIGATWTVIPYLTWLIKDHPIKKKIFGCTIALLTLFLISCSDDAQLTKRSITSGCEVESTLKPGKSWTIEANTSTQHPDLVLSVEHITTEHLIRINHEEAITSLSLNSETGEYKVGLVICGTGTSGLPYTMKVYKPNGSTSTINATTGTMYVVDIQ